MVIDETLKQMEMRLTSLRATWAPRHLCSAMISRRDMRGATMPDVAAYIVQH
jgi:hypothetical protein